ncbi:MAG: Y-family DNA polymerase [Parachlamydiales bacterium]|jgi:DNA polymerase V
MFVLVDCNNFFASCEILFNPKFKNKPVVILSNNDGCVIARSKEAKKLNIKMGDPIFRYKQLVQSDILKVFSSNFTLYGDISIRVMKTLETFMLPMEIYSIDEAFLYIDKEIDFFTLAKTIKEKIYKWVGIEVSIGIAKTKTLAKLANRSAKNTNGISILSDKNDLEKILKATSIEEIWGIGSKLKKRLYQLDIYSAYDLAKANEYLIKKNLSVNVYKTSLELNEVKCFECEEIQESKKSITTSRSFAEKIDNINDLEEAISSFVAMTSEKLRESKLKAGFMTIFVMTSPFAKDNYYSNYINITLPIATSFTPNLISHAKNGLKKIYKEGFLYKKAGVILSNFTDESAIQEDFFTNVDDASKKRLMKTVDEINYKSNKKTVFFGSEGIKKKYKSSSNMRSKNFTTSFDELIKVK